MDYVGDIVMGPM